MSAATLLAVNTILLVVALADPTVFGLTATETVLLGVPTLLIQLGLAALPWQRILPQRPMPWLLRGTVVYYVLGLLAALALADDAATEALWLLAFTLVYSALVLPMAEQAVATAGSVLGAVVVLAATSGIDRFAIVDLAALTGIGVLATIGSRVVLGALERAEAARREADASASALRDALVAVHTTSSGDIQQILDATARAAVRGPADMAGVYVIDEDETLVAYADVPPELRMTDPDAIRGIVASIEDRGPAVLDFEGPDGDLLPPEQRGTLRASIVAPVRRRGRVIGALTVTRTSGPLFSSGEQVALELLADHVARGIVLSRELAADREALERLRELDRMKRDFVATVSHEMRTPLTVITGLSETLQEHGPRLAASMREQLVTRLRSNAATLDRIVTGLLDASGIDRGIIAVQQDDVDLAELLQETAGRLEPLFDEHQLRVEVEPGLHVAGDPALLERVLENLLTNAQRHTPPGTVVRLVGRRDEGPRGLVVVEVADDGPGIAPDEVAHVLDRFVRGGPPDERSTRGLGLGLALSDEVLRLHGSSLEIESTLGTGTTFRFTLRPTPAPVPTPDPAEVRPEPGS